MTIPQTKIMLCNCGKSMPLDGTTINEACGQADASSDVATSLCRAQQDRLAAAMEALGADEQLLVACTQEEKTFEDASKSNKPKYVLRYIECTFACFWCLTHLAAFQ